MTVLLAVVWFLAGTMVGWGVSTLAPGAHWCTAASRAA
jgi:hypothetical protein